MHTNVITSPFISLADRVIKTRTVEAGLTVGNVARFAKAVASTATLKSPAAIVGLDLNPDVPLAFSSAMRIRKSSFFLGGLYGEAS